MTGLRVRPTAETFPLDDLVEWARNGRIRVPSFQRGLRWTRRDVLALFDSVLKGYPVGSLLLWERVLPVEAVVLGPLRVEAAAGPAFSVIDGQQRITALACALTEAGHSDQRFAVGYDLATDSFTPRSSHVPETWVPAHVLYDLSVLLAWFRDRPALMDRFEAASAVSKTLRDLKLPAYVVRQDDEAVLRAIFDRMNNAGKKLTRGEVFGALHRSDGVAAAGTLRSVAEQIEERTAFGALPESVVMKMVLVRRGPNVMREIRNEFDPGTKGRDDFAAAEGRDEAFVRTADAAVTTIEFLQNVVGVPHQSLLPYQHLLVTLTRFFAHHPHPTARHTSLLRRFFWRAVVAGPTLNRGDLTGTGRLLNRQVVVDDELASTEALAAVAARAAPAAGQSPLYPSVDPLRTNSAASKALLCAMWDRGPRGLDDPSRMTITDLQAALADQHTPAAIVVPMLTGVRAGAHEREAGNQLLLVADADRDSDVLEALAAADEIVLASHLLEPDDVSRLLTGEVSVPLAARTSRLDEVQRTFLDRMCEWSQEDTPDLLMLMGEGPDVRAAG